ncbi:MAG: flagellar biosynthetic protein FliO [Oscillospiraceae bacterium]|jgi:flagellar biogenesis protein FliO|nr:flagellar biosynthetic protein FliO [Oscillospiraceae bacterium]
MPAQSSATPFQGILTIVIIVLVIAVAYYATYLIGAHGNRQLNGRMIRVRERFALSRDKMFCVVEFNNKLYFIAITNGGVEVIDKVDSAEFDTVTAAAPPNFVDALKKAWENRKGGGA